MGQTKAKIKETPETLFGTFQLGTQVFSRRIVVSTD